MTLEAPKKDHWTDEVSQAWLDDANQRYERTVEAGMKSGKEGYLLEALQKTMAGMPPAVHELSDRQDIARVERVIAILEKGRSISTLDLMLELGDTEVVSGRD